MAGIGEGRRERVMLASAPSALLRMRTVARDLTDTPASETPGLLILHPVHLARWETRKKVKDNRRRWGYRKVPGDDDTFDGFTVLNEAFRSIHSRKTQGQGRVNTDRITS